MQKNKKQTKKTSKILTLYMATAAGTSAFKGKALIRYSIL